MTCDPRLLATTILFVLLAGCEGDRDRMIRYCQEHHIEYHVGDREDDWTIKHIRWSQQNGGASESQLEYLRDHGPQEN